MRNATRFLPLAAILAPFLLTTACDSRNASSAPAPMPTPTPTPAPTPTPTPSSFNVTRCINQQVAPGVTVANLVVPDTLTINLQQPSGFPNGRRLTDQVIDITLAVIFLDLTKHSARTFADLPLGPAANDVPFLDAFPYLAPANGTNPQVPAGANFNFRTDPLSTYVRVDRMGMPAVATALISSSNKNAYNDDGPPQDVAGKWVPELTSVLISLTNALADDLQRLNLSPCATRS